MESMQPTGTPIEAAAPPVSAGLPVTGYCRTCGKPLTEETKRAAFGTIFCLEHVPALPAATPEAGSPYAAPAPVSGSASPALAWILGFFVPGLGAIYNGQYAKGFVHVLIFGLLISLISSDASSGFEPLLAISLAGFVFYQAFEAYHTAKKREQGLKIDEFSSILNLRGQGAPIAPLAMIILGVLFLLANLGWLRLAQILRFWPVGLIGLGAYMLYSRTKGGASDAE